MAKNGFRVIPALVVSVLVGLVFVACSENTSGFRGGDPKSSQLKKTPPEAPGQSDAVVNGGDNADVTKDSDASESEPQGGSNEAAVLLEGCSQPNLKTQTFSVNFPARQGCLWDRGMAGQMNMGHFEQKSQLAVSPNFIVCSMKIGGAKAGLLYDDKLLLNFNGVALMGSPGMIDFLEKDAQGLPVYNWERLFQKKALVGSKCIPGASKCELPETEQTGTFALELDTATNLKLMALAINQKKFEFTLLTTGDNDPSKDCRHTGIPLDVTVTYYTK